MLNNPRKKITNLEQPGFVARPTLKKSSVSYKKLTNAKQSKEKNYQLGTTRVCGKTNP
jgi:hypothetical protein